VVELEVPPPTIISSLNFLKTNTITITDIVDKVVGIVHNV